MKQLWLAVPVILAASAGAAQDVLFKSGEHEDYTRLVATLPSEDTQWSVARDGRFYTIKIHGDNVNLRTSTIFDRIPRDRLSSFLNNSAQGELELELNCDCRVVSIPYDGRYVIFDIRDELVTQNDDLPQIPLSFGEAIASEEVPQRKFRFSAIEASKPAPKIPVKAQPQQDFSQLLAFENYVERNAQVQTLRGDLIAQVDRAANQNLLKAAPAKPESSLVSAPMKTASVPEIGGGDDHVPPQAAHGPEGGDLNIVAYNVIDEVGRDIAALLQGQVSANMCLPDTAVAIESWSGETTFVQDLARLRQEVVGEFDITNTEALDKMARLYVHYTFGAEARQVLSLLPTTGESEILDAMARIMDGTLDRDAENAFANQGHCKGHSALWAALSGQTLVGDSAIRGAMDALHQMPRHLREYLGPKLSNQLVKQGATEPATLVLNALERSNATPNVSMDYAQARLDAELGNTEEAEAALDEIASENSDLATQAVLDLIDSHVAKGMPVAAETVSLVGALAVEHKSGAMGPPLRRAHALARMLAHDFDAAFDVLDTIETRDGAAVATKVRSQVALEMAEVADSFDLMSWTLEQDLAEPGRVSADAAMALAQKVFDAGFVGETKRLLQAAQMTVPTQEKRVLMARIALAENLPKRAEAELLGIDSPEAERLRADARAMDGDHAGAARLLASLGHRPEAETEAWLDGDFASLTASENEVYRKTSELVVPAGEETSGEEIVDDSPQGILARNRELLKNAAESRGVLGELLNLHSLSEPNS